MIGLFAAGGVFVFLAWLYRGFWVDDAFISMRYVLQFVSGNGLVYNIGERVEGYSNFLWIMLLALARWLGFDLVVAAKVLGAALGVACIGITWLLARGLPLRMVSPCMVAVSPAFVAWSMGGLETHLFALLLGASAWALLRSDEARLDPLAGALLGLLALARPEGLMFVVLAVGFRLWRWWRGAPSLQRTEWLGVALMGVIVVAFYAWRLAYYGYPLPNTVYAKSMGLLNPRAWMEGAYYVLQSLLLTGGALGVVIALGAAVWRGLSVRLQFVGVALSGYAAFTVVGGGDWMPLQRFLAHVMPLVAVMIHAGLAALVELLPIARQRLALMTLVGVQVGALLFQTLDLRFVQGVGAGGEDMAFVGGERMVAYLRERAAPEDVIAVDVAGLLAYALPLEQRILDLNGLTDAHIAHRPPQFPRGFFGRGDGFGKWDVDYVLAQQPRFVQVSLQFIGEDGTLHTANTGQDLLINDPRFREQYEMVSDDPASGLFGLFRRK